MKPSQNFALLFVQYATIIKPLYEDNDAHPERKAKEIIAKTMLHGPQSSRCGFALMELVNISNHDISVNL
jgi:hypothetical protein